MLGNGWNGGYVAQISVSSSTQLNHWTVTIADPYATKVISTWGVVCSLVTGGIQCTGDDWGAVIGAGSRQLVGLVVESGFPPTNPALTVGG
jgi:endoglucanase